MNSFIDSDGGGSDSGFGYDYEEVETLSFCDLPTQSSGGGGASFESKEGMHSSSEDQEDDFFEFFSGDLDSTSWDIDNVIFCGKLMPYRTPPAAHQTIKKNNEHQLPIIKKQRQRFLEWKSGKNTTESRILSDGRDKKRKCGVASANNKKLAAAGELILASPTKAKWHLFLFGFTKNPTVIELSDMKNRQHRRTASSPVKYQSFDQSTKVKEDTRNTSKKKTNSTTSRKGLWKLLKAICCKNKVSIGGI